MLPAASFSLHTCPCVLLGVAFSAGKVCEGCGPWWAWLPCQPRPQPSPGGPIVQSGKLRLGPTVMSKQALFLSYLADILPSIMKFPLLFPCSRVMLRRPGTVVGLAGGPPPCSPTATGQV